MKALKVETEQKIINTAKEVFIEKGLQGARMQEIADKAGINKALLHYYYRSKDKLFDAVFDDVVQQLIPEFSKIFSMEKPLNELIEGFVEFYNRFFMENPFLPQFFFHEIWQNPDKLARVISEQEVRPADLASNLSDKLPPLADTEYLPQHMIASVLGMTLFPHIARPLFQRIFFENSDQKYNDFLGERNDFIMKFLSGHIENSSQNADEDPQEDF